MSEVGGRADGRVVTPSPLSRNAGKCRKKITSLEEEMKDMNTRKEGLKNTLTSLEDEAREILAKQEKIRVRGEGLKYELAMGGGGVRGVVMGEAGVWLWEGPGLQTKGLVVGGAGGMARSGLMA